jgi:hypothetical protein
LAEDFVAHGFDLKHTIRTILNSRTYQAASSARDGRPEDARYFAHASVRLLSAEELLDAISQVTEVPEVLFHLPAGTRAAQLPDGEFYHPFLRIFGPPVRSLACECERSADSTLEQALQLVGGRAIHAKITAPDNRIGRLLKAGCDDRAIVDDLFLAALGREPCSEERRLSLGRFSKPGANRRQVVEDLLWSLFNHPEFLFQH